MCTTVSVVGNLTPQFVRGLKTLKSILFQMFYMCTFLSLTFVKIVAVAIFHIIHIFLDLFMS